MAKFVTIKTGEVVTLACFMSRSVTASVGSDLSSTKFQRQYVHMAG